MPILRCNIGEGTVILHEHLVNLYDCTIGKNCSIGAFTEIGEGVIIGDNTRIGAFCFIPPGIEIGNNAFIAPRVTFMNDLYPPTPKDVFIPMKTYIGDHAVIGAGSKILPGITIGVNCKVGAGSVVTRDISESAIWHKGNPARGR